MSYRWVAKQNDIVLAQGSGDELPFAPTDNGRVFIELTLEDDGVQVGSASYHVQVANAAPVIDLVSSAVIKERETARIEGSFRDADILDTHTVTIEWDDGHSDSMILPVGERSLKIQHDYDFGGIYEIGVIVQDDDGSIDSSAVSAVVSGIGLKDGVLQIIGTSQADHVTINPAGHGLVTVHADFLTDGVPVKTRNYNYSLNGSSSIDRTIMLLCGGDDHATVSSGISLATIIDGGTGDDHLTGGGG